LEINLRNFYKIISAASAVKKHAACGMRYKQGAKGKGLFRNNNIVNLTPCIDIQKFTSLKGFNIFNRGCSPRYAKAKDSDHEGVEWESRSLYTDPWCNFFSCRGVLHPPLQEKKLPV
jgi:hypothetical protein